MKHQNPHYNVLSYSGISQLVRSSSSPENLHGKKMAPLYSGCRAVELLAWEIRQEIRRASRLFFSFCACVLGEGSCSSDVIEIYQAKIY